MHDTQLADSLFVAGIEGTHQQYLRSVTRDIPDRVGRLCVRIARFTNIDNPLFHGHDRRRATLAAAERPLRETCFWRQLQSN